jgi:ribosomal protein L29
MNIKDLRQLTEAELLTRAAELRGIIRDLRFTVTTRQHAKVRDLRKAKQELAQVLTVLRENIKTVEPIKKIES